MSADAAEMPVNPKMPAMIETTRKIRAHLSSDIIRVPFPKQVVAGFLVPPASAAADQFAFMLVLSTSSRHFAISAAMKAPNSCGVLLAAGS